MTPPRNSLSILANTPTAVTFGRYQLELTPITTGELNQLLPLVGHLLPLLDAVNTAEDVLALLADHGDRVLQAVAIAARLPREQVDALMPDEVAELLLGLMEVNVDFFVHRTTSLTARVQAGRERLAAALTAAGKTPLPA